MRQLPRDRILPLAMQRHRTRVVNRLPALLEEHGLTWGELARRTLLPARLLARLRVPGANPRLAVAERVAAALDARVEDVWRLLRPGRRRAR